MKKWGVRLLLALLVFEVLALHLNRRPIHLVAKEIRLGKPGENYGPRLICELKNDRITPIRYFAVRDDMPGYEIIRQDGGIVARNFRCTSSFDHLVAPFSSKEVWIWISHPDSAPKISVSILYEDTSLLSWLPWLWPDDRRATVEVEFLKLPRRE